ncbi:MAG: sulfate ABC transporter substrate-binding protein, partial [Gammaproteobacteria bacterium]|nr:sulfate ABC transporter substrate-binding protein [Gammaproteobacteria bacterium]
AQAYLEFLYTDVAQNLIGRYYYRPANQEIAAQYAHQFPPLSLFTITDVFGGWAKANAAHFADGASFDQIYQPGRR